MQRVEVSSAAKDTAAVLREMILRDIRGSEWLIGSEEDVMRQLHVSRPTLRQAVRILEHEQLITVRRGNSGGLFGRRPSNEGVTANASIYLRAEGATYGDLMTMLRQLSVDSATRAGNAPAERRKSLASYYDDALAGADPVGVHSFEFASISGGFYLELAAISESVTLTLFVNVVVDLLLPAVAASLYTPDRIVQTVERHHGIAAAVVVGDSETAAARTREHFDAVRGWFDPGVKLEVRHPRLHVFRRPGAR